MSTTSQGLRALASLMETICPELSGGAQSALGGVADQLHSAADAEAAAEAERLGGPVAGPILSSFTTAVVDSFFAVMGLGRPPSVASATTGNVAVR